MRYVMAWDSLSRTCIGQVGPAFVTQILTKAVEIVDTTGRSRLLPGKVTMASDGAGREVHWAQAI